MNKELKIAIIGLDTSHSVEFTRMMQAPDYPEDKKIKGMKVVSCMRFVTPFQNEEGLDKRQRQLEEWGVKVTTDFNKAVEDCDVIMLEINDPSYHLEYFKKCKDLGKPIFIDKPLADNFKNGKEIYDITKKQNLRVFSASSLRFATQLKEVCDAVPVPLFTYVYGSLAKAPAGSSIVWYGVHAFEMLQRAMGRGAISVFAREDPAGVVAVIDYPNGKRGIVELTYGLPQYGGCIRNKEKSIPFVVDLSTIYFNELLEVERFFNGAEAPVELEDTLEIMAMLDATDHSLKSGKTEKIEQITMS